MWAIYLVIKNKPKVNTHPMGEISPDLVTLLTKSPSFLYNCGYCYPACPETYQNVQKPTLGPIFRHFSTKDNFLL
jgi:hypothetical protein